MKFNWFLVLAIISLSFASACSQSGPTVAVDRKTPLFENEVQASDRAAIMSAASDFLALQTGLDPQDFQYLRFESASWDNLCLDYPDPLETCPVETVSGYKFFFVVNNLLYEVHSNQNGSDLRISPEIVFSNPPIENVIKLLASQLNVPPEQIRFLNSEQVIWQDSCLEMPSQSDCQKVDIPGFRILLEASQQQFEYHTNLDGSLIIGNLASQSTQEPLLTWQNSADGCFNLDFYQSSVIIYTCDGQTQSQQNLSAGDQGELLTLMTTYAPFLSETQDGTIHLFGLGSARITEKGISSIADWLQSVHDSLFPETGQSDPLMDYMFLSMERRYFNAAVVERLVITRDLVLVVSNNEGFEKRDIKLSDAQLLQLINWGKSFSYEKFTVRDDIAQWETDISFYGSGQQTLSENDRTALVAFAQQLYAQHASGDTKCKLCKQP